jgi:IS30 family transposase
LFGISRQAWYFQKQETQKEALETEIILKSVNEKRKQMPRIGAKKLMYLLSDEFEGHGIKMGRDKFFDFLRANNLLINKKRKYTKTTDSFHRYHKYPNLIKNIRYIKPNKLYVSDITYIRLKTGFAYLSLITDAYSRKIVGYKLHPDLSKEGCIYALQMAVSNLKSDDKHIIHHSDRGSQYCSDEYVRILKKNHFLISMTENGDPYENAIAERVNGILKDEFNLDATFDSFSHAEEKVRISIDTYNMHRPHLSLNYKTPFNVHFEENVSCKYHYKISNYNAGTGGVIVSDKQNYFGTINPSRTSPTGF